MENNPDFGLVMPKILYPNGEIQYLYKLLPTSFDLILKRDYILPLNGIWIIKAGLIA